MRAFIVTLALLWTVPSFGQVYSPFRFSIAGSGGSCTDGVDCFCDTTSGDSLKVFCEDYELASFYENVEGSWLDGELLSGVYWDRGADSDWENLYGSGVGGGRSNWNDGVPTLGSRCELGSGSPGGQASCSGQREWCSTAQGTLAGAGLDCWGPNVNDNAYIDIQRSGDFDEEVATQTLTGGSGVTADVGAGNQHMAYRIGPGSTHGLIGGLSWTPVTELGVTMLVALSSNYGTDGPAFDFTKFDEFGDYPEAEYFMMGNFTTSNMAVYPFAPFMFHADKNTSDATACNTALAAATNKIGSWSCGGTALRYRAIEGTGTNQYNQATDWPWGTWGCVQAHIKGMGTSDMELRIWFEEELLIQIDDFDGTVLWNQDYDDVVFNAYANGNEGTGGDDTTVTTHRYQDNYYFRNGAPISCDVIRELIPFETP